MKRLLDGSRRLLRVLGRPVALACTVLVLGVAFSVSLALLTRAAAHRDAKASNDRRTAAVAAAIHAEVTRFEATMRTLAAALGSHRDIDHTTFNTIAAPTVRARPPGGASLYFAVPVTDEKVASAQAYWRRHGSDGLVLRPEGKGHEHVMVVLGRPLDGKPVSLGVDMGRLPAPTRAMYDAHRTGDVAISDAYRLYKDRGLSPDRQQLSFVLAAPVYAPPDAHGRQGAFRGWVVMSLRSGNLLKAVLTDVSQGLINVTLHATTSDGRQVPVAHLHNGRANDDQPVRAVFVQAGTKQWLLRVQATDLEQRMRSPVVSLVMLRGIGGSVLSALFAGVVYLLASSRERGQVRVEEATADARRAEAEARQHGDLLQSIMDSVSEGVNVVDRDGRYLLRNPAGRRILGTKDDLEATGPMDPRIRHQFFKPDGMTLFPANELPLLRALAGESVDGVEMVVRSVIHPGGVVITASSRPLMSGTEQIGAVVAFRDITAQKRTGQKLAESNQLLSSELARREAAEIELRTALEDLADQKAYLTQVLDALKVAVTTCDTHGMVVHRNRTGRQWMPMFPSPDSVRATAAAGAFTDVDGRPLSVERLPLQRALAGEVVDEHELLLVSGEGGAPRHVLVHSRPLHDASGRLVGAVSSAYDITALREREAELRDFAGAVAHDLKGPLSAVIGHLEIVTDIITADGAPLPERLSRSLDRAGGGAQRMSQLISDLLDYVSARDATLKMVPVDLAALVDRVVEEYTADLSASNGAAAPDVFSGPMPVVRADPRFLRQVLDNLIGNAVKYTHPGERARIDISAHHLAGGQVRVEVADRGIGVPPDQRDKVFNTFHRAHTGAGYTGTGLGLAICKRIVEHHGGVIGVEDNPGGGSRFYFTVPGAPEPASAAPEEKVGAQGLH